jgi:hypothetical protein
MSDMWRDVARPSPELAPVTTATEPGAAPEPGAEGVQEGGGTRQLPAGGEGSRDSTYSDISCRFTKA